MFTAYYILAVSFGVVMALISLYAIKFRPDDSFPGKFYVPLMILGALFAVSTLTAVIHGGNEEVAHRKAEAAAEGVSGAAVESGKASQAIDKTKAAPATGGSSSPDNPTNNN